MEPDSILFFLVVVVGASLPVVFLFWKFKWGLATRISTIVLPSIASVCIIIYLATKAGFTSGTLLVAIPLAVLCSWAPLYFLYRAVVSELAGHVNEVQSNVAQLSATAKQTASTAAQQSALVAEVTSTIEEIEQTSNATASIAQEVVNVATDAVKSGQEGLHTVAEAVRVIEAISQVKDVVDRVNDLAEQSNLLALNASIESSKAGEHGKGFAVVASEVRKLAEKSKQATHQIRSAINRVDEGRQALEKVDKSIGSLATVLDETADKARQISSAVVQQFDGVKHICEAMVSVAQGGEEISQASEQIEQSVDNLTNLGKGLMKFTTGRV